MTAQDFDLQPFSVDDWKTLRDKVETLNIPPAIKVS
jgi:hypothetical protein